MKKSRFTESQIIAILREADAGMKVKELCRKHGISDATYYNWKAKYGGMGVSELKRMKELEAENARFKRMYADLALENRAMKDLIEKALTPPEKREAAAYLVKQHGLSIGRGCRCVGLSRAAWYHTPLDWQERDAEVIDALNALAEAHLRLGFWKYPDRLRAQGYAWNHKRIYRVYCALGLNQPRRTKRRLPERVREPLLDQVWSADFMSDTLYHDPRFRSFNVIDDYNREAMAIEIDTSLRAPRVVRVLERLKEQGRLPDVLRVDNGPEFLRTA